MAKRNDYVYIYLHENKVTVCHGEEDKELMDYHDVTALRYKPETGVTEVFTKKLFGKVRQQTRWEWMKVEDGTT